MIYAAPGATFEAVAQGFATGLVGTIGARLIDNVGGTTTARVTAGITEFPASWGVYELVMTAPTTQGEYTVIWDDGTVSPSHVATESLTVTSSAVVTANTANEYVTRASLKTTLELTSETYADSDIDDAVAAASRAVDALCGRRFYADADAAQVRYYTPWETELVRIDDLVTLTSLKTDPGGDGTYEDTWTVDTDFVLLPLNRELIDGTNREPYRLIQRHPNGNYKFVIKYPRTVQLTGKFGWPAVPPAVEQATRVLAGRLLKRARETPYGIVGIGLDGGAVRMARTDPDVSSLLEPYVRSFPFL